MTTNLIANRRVMIMGGIVLAALLVVLSDSLHSRSEALIVQVQAIIVQYPLLGVIVFVLLAMASAMLAFLSSAIIVPIGVYSWGSLATLLLLWIGWILGGFASYAVGLFFGKPVARKFVGEEQFSSFEASVGKNAKFFHVLLFQAAVPSEIPGYLLGTVGYSFRKFTAALILVELPYAIGTVYMGSSFVERQPWRFLIVGVIALLISAGSYYVYRQHLQKPEAGGE